MLKRKIIIAIDGYSSTGKSTFAKKVADLMGYIYIDTGALYRAITLHSMRLGLINLENPKEINLTRLNIELESIEVDFQRDQSTGICQTMLNNEVVEAEIRSFNVSNLVSYISTIQEVRDYVDTRLKIFGVNKGIVMDGRDIGSSVFPNAELKIFMTADPKIRAERRLRDLREKGDTETTFDMVLVNIQERDHIDQTRILSPLKKAEDAMILDNSEMTLESQIVWIKEIIKKMDESLDEI